MHQKALPALWPHQIPSFTALCPPSPPHTPLTSISLPAPIPSPSTPSRTRLSLQGRGTYGARSPTESSGTLPEGAIWGTLRNPQRGCIAARHTARKGPTASRETQVSLPHKIPPLLSRARAGSGSGLGLWGPALGMEWPCG